MHLALSLMDLALAGVNSYWCFQAYKNPHIYPRWYLYLTGIFAAYCLVVTFI